MTKMPWNLSKKEAVLPVTMVTMVWILDDLGFTHMIQYPISSSKMIQHHLILISSRTIYNQPYLYYGWGSKPSLGGMVGLWKPHSSRCREKKLPARTGLQKQNIKLHKHDIIWYNMIYIYIHIIDYGCIYIYNYIYI